LLNDAAFCFASDVDDAPHALSASSLRVGLPFSSKSGPFTPAMRAKKLEAHLVRNVAAVSVGIVDGQAVLDLPYEEDSRADVDLNVVATDAGHYVELQGTAEQDPFHRTALDEMLKLADAGIADLIKFQRDTLAGA
jgi:ribonuclease PH